MAPATAVKNCPPPLVLDIRRPADVDRAGAAARNFGPGVGFNERECEQLALAAAELASNLIRHARGGSLKFTAVSVADRRGIQIESEDAGPGISNVELALTDGYSTAGGLGNGLGTVNRLMDELEFQDRSPVGLRILCQRWVRPATGSITARRLECGAAARACRRAAENGDAIVIQQWQNEALVGVIDGVGHGTFAQRAARAARKYVEEHFDQPLANLFRGVGHTCRATRGVVMALARFDLVRQTVTLASIGNVESRLVGGQGPVHWVSRRGILGFQSPEPLVTERPWTAEHLLIMHSDGLEGRWKWEQFAELAQEPAALIARHLLLKLGKNEDDATVVVARNAKAC